jgi:hypothetical protein
MKKNKVAQQGRKKIGLDWTGRRTKGGGRNNK